MEKLLLLITMGFAFWHYCLKPSDSPVVSQPFSTPVAQPFTTSAPAQSVYRCDGRTHCSQMRSCEEANYFLRNCPGTQMDGNHDGVPCERQWCQ